MNKRSEQILEVKNVRVLLSRTKQVVKHQKEIESLKGERFNIFSVLKMERLENKTHSAFISELLNPNGTHQKGDIFLKLFLNQLTIHSLNLNSTFVCKTEKDIGKIDYNEKNGGRIDIYIEDKEGNSISIENKIDAGDQLFQIERYYNYNKDKNKVYYLNLFGKGPTTESKGELKLEEDYYILSYKDDIIHWLELCIKESADSPMLRETIKQYKLLIQKLTSTMDNKTEAELINVMLESFEEASYISANFAKAQQKITEEIRQEVIKQLKENYSDVYTIVEGNATNKKYSQIWIKLKNKESEKMYFGLESFSGSGNFGGNLFIGTFVTDKEKSEYSRLRGFVESSPYWINVKEISAYDNYTVNLSSNELLLKIISDINFKSDIVKHIVYEVAQYLSDESSHLLDFLNKKV